MGSRVYGYFVLPDGSISTTRPFTRYCMTFSAETKRQAELELPYLDFDRDVFAEIQVSGESHRILFVRAGALSSRGLHQHIFIGTGTYQSLEIIASEPSSLSLRISSVLDDLDYNNQVVLLAIKPLRRFTPEVVIQGIHEIARIWGKPLPGEFFPFRCFSIPKHYAGSPDHYPGATRLPVPWWEA